VSRLPRLLPLVGVAIGGVLAVKALSEVEVIPQALAGARAFAQAPAKPAPKPAAQTPAKPAAAAPQAAAQSNVCTPSAADLAREAGLSPAELQVLQNLGTRRTQLDAREQQLDTQLQLLAAAEAKLDSRLKELNGLKAEVQALMGQADQKESAEIDRLVTVYSKMKPRDAAAVMTQLDDRVRIPVAAKMKEAALAAVLSQMPPAEAKKLTESLAHRFDKARELVQAMNNPPPAEDAAAAGPPAKAAAKKAGKVAKKG
jgi:flagellar motility protein MotE (MotC chaperone)